MTDVDVAIVGFGPVGAALAGLLGGRGIRTVVVDRDPEVFALPRAAHIDHTGLRVLQELGCVDELLAGMLPNRGLEFVTADRRLLHRIPGDQGSVSGLPASMYFHQPGFDRALRRVASALPCVDVRLGVEAVGLRQDPPADGDAVGATLLVSGDGGDTVTEIGARWVVGCDGAWSMVRETVAAPLESVDFDETWLVVDLVLHPGATGLPDHAVHVCDPARPHTAIPMPGDRYRFELMTLPGDDLDQVATPEGVGELLAPWLAPDRYAVERAATYTFHGLVAREWRRGRVLLAGDAAHQMPPFLGQGMCSGLRDAANLAWKLASVLGGAPDALLDTYAAERGPHVADIVGAAVDFGEIICTLDPVRAAQRDARTLAGAPLTDRPFRLARLEQGALVGPGGGELAPQPQVGGLRLDDVVGPRCLVLAADDAALESSAPWWRDAVGALVATTGELDDEAGTLASWLARREARVAVVRPDRYVLELGPGLDQITHRVGGLLAATEPSRTT